MIDGRLQPYEWARARLAAAFGDEAVRLETSDDGGRVTATVARPEGEPYLVILRDPVLGNVNGLADPQGFVEAETRFARAFFDGTSRRRQTFG